MRENMGLYRGKRKANGEWVFGALYKQTHFYGDPCAEWYIITSTESLEYDQELEYHEVDPETVGQYTGVTDKNGKKVFEHDIVRFDRCTFVVEFAYFRMGFCFNGLHGRGCVPGFTMAHWEHLEVIGNIHDNPELLDEKGKTNEL